MAGRRDQPRLAHAAAQHLGRSPSLGHERIVARQDRTYRAPSPLQTANQTESTWLAISAAARRDMTRR